MTLITVSYHCIEIKYNQHYTNFLTYPYTKSNTDETTKNEASMQSNCKLLFSFLVWIHLGIFLKKQNKQKTERCFPYMSTY